MRFRSGGRAVVAAVLVMAALSVVGGSPSSGAPASPISVSSSSGSFAQVAVGDVGTKVFTVKNTSASAVGFTLTVGVPPFGIYPGGTTCTGGTLAPGASCKVTVWFSPTVTGSYSGSLRVLADGSGADPVGTELASGALSGQGIASWTITPSSSSSWSFGNWAIGSTTASKTFTVTNRHAPGGVLQTISNVMVTGSDFVLTGGTCEVGLGVPAKGSCTVDVAFKPTSAGFGTASGQVRVDVAPDAPVAVNLSGQKVTSVGFSPSRLAFGEVEERETQYRFVTVANQASFPVTLGSPTLSVSPPFFASSQCPATLAAGASCQVRVTFTPTSVGARSAVMRLPVVDPVSGPYTAAVNISATATPTRASVIIGYSAVAVPRSDSCGNPSGRTCESLSGDVISDSLRSTYGTDFAIMNSGSIRADLTCSPGGPSCPVATGAPFAITRGQVYSVLPFGNRALTATVTGTYVRDSLENAVSRMPLQDGRFGQVSGLCFTYDISGAPGSRVTSVVRQAADGSCSGPAVDLSASSSYRVAINDFMAEGGDGYPTVNGASGALVVDVVRDQIAITANPTPISPVIGGRITCTDSNLSDGSNCPIG